MAEKNKPHVSLYRALHHLNKGGLHRALGFAEGTKIPEEAVEKATHSHNEHIAHMARFAQTLSGFHHKK